MASERTLTDVERQTYEWQMWVEDFGEAGQQRLKNATVLVTRCGGLGGVVAYELAAAGIGRLVLAHAGDLQPSDLNRQILMSHGGLGSSRIEQAKERLLQFNPRLEVEAVPENVGVENARSLVGQADLVVDCAPLFEERFHLNRQIVQQRKPMVDCAMFDLEAHLTTIVPGRTPCLQCLYPDRPRAWKRQFPVFGAVSGTIGCMAAMEAIKQIAQFGRTLESKLLVCDLREMTFRRLQLRRNSNCPVCSTLDDPAPVESQESSGERPGSCL